MRINLKYAGKDLYYLLNKDYPKKIICKLIGDRYQLTKSERIILYRGISNQETAKKRTAKLSLNPIGKKLSMDGYNILFSIYNHLLGKTLFICNDGFLRDVGDPKPTFKNQKILIKTLDLFINYIIYLKPVKLLIYLDSPVDESDTLSRSILHKIQTKSIPATVLVVPSADQALIMEKNSIIVTSDSIIIDKTQNPVTDLLGNSRFTPELNTHPIIQKPLLDLRQIIFN